MAVSSSSNYSLNRDAIITEALQIAGVVGEGGTPNANQLTDCSRTLNVLAKDWVADGLHMWKNEAVVIFPVAGQIKYTLKSGGDRACLLSDYVKTELNGNHSSGATSLTVDSTTGMTASDVIGVEEDDGTLTWTTIVSVDSSTTLTITAGLGSACADNNNVYTYTTVIAEKPVSVIKAYLKQDDGTSIPVDMITNSEYQELSDKDTTGSITQLWYEPKLTSMEINVWQPPSTSNINEVLICVCQFMVYDFDAAGDDMDFPIEWGRALIWNLAEDLCEKYQQDSPKMNRIMTKAAYLKQRVDEYDIELGSIYLQPDYN